MENATTRYVATKAQDIAPGEIKGPDGTWRFVYDQSQVPIISSERKRIYRGSFEDLAHDRAVAACAISFEPCSVAAFGNECANLGLLTSLGVGPKLLAITQQRFEGMGAASPTIIEEDAGESLARLLQEETQGLGRRPILHPAGTPERDAENQKILYDVYVQISNAHRAGVYHRDLRCENVCVRRFGRNPADIRATVIDFELSAALVSGEPRARANLFWTLFSEIPSHVVGERFSIVPNPLELDMGYLAALQYHIERGGLILNGSGHPKETIDDFLEFLGRSVGYFGYSELAAPPYARHLNQVDDIDRLAGALELVPVNKTTFASKSLLERAESYHRPYLDAEDVDDCMSGAEARLAEMVERLVETKFESYKALRRQQGLEVVYERAEDQPEDLRRSNYDQAEHVPTKVRALGYLLIPEEQAGQYVEVTSFTDDQIEALARLEHDRWMRERIDAGWTLDRHADGSDPEKRTSPYLVPYDELSHEIQEYDRDAVRQLIPLIRSAGLMVVRPKS